MHIYTYPGELINILVLNLISIHSLICIEHVRENDCSAMYGYVNFWTVSNHDICWLIEQEYLTKWRYKISEALHFLLGTQGTSSSLCLLRTNIILQYDISGFRVGDLIQKTRLKLRNMRVFVWERLIQYSNHNHLILHAGNTHDAIVIGLVGW